MSRTLCLPFFKYSPDTTRLRIVPNLPRDIPQFAFGQPQICPPHKPELIPETAVMLIKHLDLPLAILQLISRNNSEISQSSHENTPVHPWKAPISPTMCPTIVCAGPTFAHKCHVNFTCWTTAGPQWYESSEQAHNTDSL